GSDSSGPSSRHGHRAGCARSRLGAAVVGGLASGSHGFPTSVPGAPAGTFADEAPTTPSVDVLGRESVASLAVGVLDRLAAPAILDVLDRLKVIRSHACRRST